MTQRFGAEIQVTPALDTPAVNLSADLAAGRADPSPSPQPDADDHPLSAEADIGDRCARETQQTVECRGDAHVVLLRKPLTFKQPAACRRGRRRVTCVLRNLRTNPASRKPCSGGPTYASLTTNRREDPAKRAFIVTSGTSDTLVVDGELQDLTGVLNLPGLLSLRLRRWARQLDPVAGHPALRSLTGRKRCTRVRLDGPRSRGAPHAAASLLHRRSGLAERAARQARPRVHHRARASPWRTVMTNCGPTSTCSSSNSTVSASSM
jgi:hypothetical protein